MMFVTALLLASGCGQAPGVPTAPGEGASMSPLPAPTPRPEGQTDNPSSSPSADPSDTLSIVLRDGAGGTTRWTLTCDPVGGTHPDPAAACSALAAHGERALPGVAKDRACTQVYGGAQTASVTGRWRGEPVRSSFSLTNGCEISRWKMLQGLLPPAGS